ncbi:GapR family DNA-binding domain-containing protein [Shinella sp.]|uniref:GapR family DNA-binding domain-containing protein n=1 Tax=Shinella sp. TaxID=1870904 RepID=UPI003D2BD753
MSADIVAADQLKAIVQRVERLEGEIADLNADKSEVYKEARASGFDVKAIKKVVSKRKIEEHEREEQDHVFDIYWNAVHGLGLVHTHARENIEEFDAETGEIFDDRRSDSGLNIVTKHEDITAAPETATVPSSEQSEGNGPRDHQHVHSRQTDEAKHGGQDGEPAGADHASHLPETANETMGGTGDDCSFGNRGVWPPQGGASSSRGNDSLSVVTAGETASISQPDDGAFAEVKGRARLANADGVEPPSSGQVETPSNDDADHAAGANAGGDHVESIAERERDGTPTSNTGEGAACALPDPDRFAEDVPPTPMKRLHYAHCFPELTKAEYGRLEFSIIGIGVSRPIIRMGDVIVDGWARYNICRALGISYPIKNYSGNDVLIDVIEWQRAARNFTPAQEKKIAAELAKEIPHRADDIMAAFGLVEALEAAE